MAQCTKYFGSNRSISGLQPVSIADDFATVLVTGTFVEGPYAHDCACFTQEPSCLTDCVFFLLIFRLWTPSIQYVSSSCISAQITSQNVFLNQPMTPALPLSAKACSVVT
jgi:hypothetical protein